MGTGEAPTLRGLLDVALALQGESRPEVVLRTVLKAARSLAGARYAAIGVPDGDGGFALFLVEGVDAETWSRIGALPRTHGVLGGMLSDPKPVRMARLADDSRFRGYWPAAHPDLTSFLGIPIVTGGEIVAALYLSNKIGGDEFTVEDQECVEVLAAHAALAVVNAQKYARLRELSIADERARLARDLHDSVTQTLFSLTLSAEAATTLAEGANDARLTEQLERVRSLSATALDELRTLVDTLRSADLTREGLPTALRKRVELLRRVHDVRIDLRLDSRHRLSTPSVETEVLRVASEALSNALRHAEATRVRVDLTGAGGVLRLSVTDDGIGFDLAETLRMSGRLGLESMRERVEALGGTLRIQTAPGDGTTVTLEVARG